MALETGTFIDSLVATNPTATDALAQADDHLRLIKAVIKATFPSITGAVTLTHTQINDLQNLQGVLSAPSGTRLLFQQAASPVGWTVDATHNDKALRIVNGSVAPGTGGSVAFTAAFASHTPAGSVNTSISGNVDGTSLSVAQIPEHRHFVAAAVFGSALGALTSSNSVRRGGHEEAPINNEDYNLGGAGSTDATLGRSSAVGNSPANTHTHGTSGLSANSTFDGSGSPIDLTVQYVDFIIAQKD